MLLDILSKQNSQTLCVYILQKKLAIMKYCYLCLIISVGENLMHYGDIIKNIVLTFVLFSIFAKSIKKVVREKINLRDMFILLQKD